MVDIPESREQRLYRLFQSAVEQPSERWQAYCDRVCEGDAELRGDLGALLDEYAAHGEPRLDESDGGSMVARAYTPFALTLIGETIGRYKIVRKLGSGGMGAVFLAMQEEPVRREVALKVIRPGLDDEDIVRRFEAEAQALAIMDHPAIARVYDADLTQDGRPYFVMEYVEGAQTLTDFARVAGLDRDARLRLFSTICDAVHHGHQKGVIHRDLKPANILVDAAGRPKIIDFGIARTLGDTSGGATLTRFGQLLGTPEYMSPEQCAGDPKQVDVRSDVYSLGVVLYELLTEKLPYDLRAKSLVEATRLVQEAPPRPATPHGVRLPSDLDVVVMKALEKGQEQRYQSARELSLDLGRFLAGDPIAARPPSVRRQLLIFARRHRLVVSGAAIFVLCLLVTIVVSTRFAWIASKARAAEERRNEELSEVLYGQQVQLASGALARLDTDAARGLLDATPDVRRGFEWSYLSGQCDRSLQVIAATREPILELRYDEAGAALVGIDAAGTILRLDASTGESLEPGRTLPMTPSDVVLDRSATVAVATHRDGRVRCWDLKTGEARWRSAPIPEGRLSMAWSPGVVAIMGTSENQVWTLDDQTGAALHTYGPFSRLPSSLALADDATVLAVRTEVETALFRCSDGALIGRLDTGSGRPMAFDHSGHRLAAYMEGRLTVWDLETGNVLTQSEPIGSTRRVQWLPSDDRIVAVDGRGAVRVVEAESGRLIVTAVGPGAPLVALTTSRTGSIATGDERGEVRFWTAARDFSISKTNDVFFAAGFDPSLRWAITGGWGTAKLWNLRDGAELWTRNLFRWYINDSALSPDGTRAVVAGDEGLAVLDVYDGDTLARSEGPVAWSRVAFSRRGDVVLAGNANGDVVAMDGASLETRFSIKAHESAVRALAISPTEDLVVTGSGDPGGGVPAHSDRFAGGPASLTAVSARDGAVRWQVDTPALSVMVLAFSPDGALLACGGKDGVVRIRGARDGQVLHEVTRRGGLPVWSVAFSPDGERLLCSGPGQGVQVLDTGSWREVVILDNAASGVFALSFSRDGTRLLESSRESMRLLEYDVPAETVRNRAAIAAAQRTLDRLDVKSPLTRRIVEALRQEMGLTEEARATAIRLAEGRGENVNYLNSEVWSIVTLFGLPEEDYSHALEMARRVVSVRPETHTFWNTLGIALLQAGFAEEALATLVRSERATCEERGGAALADPLDVLGQALAHHAMGNAEAAQAELDRARDALGPSGRSADLFITRFLREAEARIESER